MVTLAWGRHTRLEQCIASDMPMRLRARDHREQLAWHA
jgi:hypothetical protein